MFMNIFLVYDWLSEIWGNERKCNDVDDDDDVAQHTIRILEKLSKRSGVKSGVPSSMNERSVKYMPK